jgi:lipopolysaccharide transport system ATP-binding protein
VADIAHEIFGVSRGSAVLRRGEFWALQNVSFDLGKGSCLGIVGRNGSGKTSLLKLVAGLLKLDEGRITVQGRVAPLIAVGAGFSPLLTGRENIGINLAILGLSDAEIRREMDSVIAFAEIEAALDAPVRTYSSGMVARLGFACAVHTRPDLLLIDETLSVGDMRFRQRCYRRLADLKDQGVSFLLVSHNAWTVTAICDSAIYLSGGHVRVIGEPHEVMRRYAEELSEDEGLELTAIGSKPENAADSPARILGIKFRDHAQREIQSPSAGRPLRVCIRIHAAEPVQSVHVSIAIRDRLQEGDWLTRLNQSTTPQAFDIEPGESEFHCDLPSLNLGPGSYLMKITLRQGSLRCFDAVESFPFRVTDPNGMGLSTLVQPNTWSLAR